MKKSWLLLLILGCMACSSPQNKIAVNISTDGHTLLVNGLPEQLLQTPGIDTAQQLWQSLLSVYRMPANEELKSDQPRQPGTYKLTGKQVHFIPDSMFVKGHVYFVRYHQLNEGGSVWDIVSKSNRPGTHPVTDVEFTP